MSNIYTGGYDATFKDAQKPVIKSEMVPYLEFAQENKIDTAIFEKLCRKEGIDLSHFYHLKEHEIMKYCYWDGTYFQAFPNLEKSFIYWDDMVKTTAERIEEAKRLRENKEYSTLLFVVDTIGQHLLFEELYSEIPSEQRYQCFIDLYVRHDYGSTIFDMNIIEDAKSKQSQDYRESALRRLLEDAEMKDGKIVIYRGMGDESTPVDEAMSWTLSEKTAFFFAKRLGETGMVYKGLVRVEEVIDYITRRSESEVLINPGTAFIEEEFPLISTQEEISNLTDEGLVAEYQAMRNHYILPDYFTNPNGLHGVKHARRVLLHCISLANAIGLDEIERGILMLSACYHDIGRKHDEACLEHGAWSVEKVNEEGLEISYLISDGYSDTYKEHMEDEDIEVMNFLMTYHSRPDEEGLRALETIEETYLQEKCKKLFLIFKDADALDRVRINDLDVTRLRTKEALMRVKFAEDVLEFLE